MTEKKAQHVYGRNSFQVAIGCALIAAALVLAISRFDLLSASVTLVIQIPVMWVINRVYRKLNQPPGWREWTGTFLGGTLANCLFNSALNFFLGPVAKF